MKNKSMGILYLGLAAGGVALAAGPEDDTERAKAVRFLRQHVMGKALEVKETVKIAKGKVEADFSSRKTFAHLVETPDGFVFDVIFHIDQTNYDVGADGHR